MTIAAPELGQLELRVAGEDRVGMLLLGELSGGYLKHARIQANGRAAEIPK